MPVEKSEREIQALVAQISRGEIKLPEIQRGYVWKPTQVAKLIESLYRGYPSGSLLLWQTDDLPDTRPVAIDAGGVAQSAIPPMFLLDGQQRLTSLHRVMNDHPDAQIVFNVETEAFQNQSAATAKDSRWLKVADVLRPGAMQYSVITRMSEALPETDLNVIGDRITRLAQIRDRKFHMEILTGFPYEEIAQIFVRVNSGRPLKTSDLALATLSARWPGVVDKLETEATHWATHNFGDLDATFLTRVLTGTVLGRGLSTWSHSRLIAATDEQLEQGWATVQRGLRHLVPLLKENLRITSSSLLPSYMVLLPLVVLLGERSDESLDAETTKGLLYWFLVATIRNRYSTSTDTRLGQDIPVTREPEPVKRLLTNLGIVGTQVEVTSQTLAGRTVGSPYFFLSYLVAKEAGATDWWHGTQISATAEDGQKLEYHHIHPQATLKNHPAKYTKTEINDLANLAFISAKANRKISDRSPRDYFTDPKLPSLTEAELGAHFVPYDETLREAGAYREFLGARRRRLAEAMTDLLDRFRPAWMDEAPLVADPLADCSLEFVLYQSAWDAGRIIAVAQRDGSTWTGSFGLADLVSALGAADGGLDSDLEISGEVCPLRVEGDSVNLTIGPFTVSGTLDEWRQMVEREKNDALPLSQCPHVAATPWEGDQTVLPVTGIE